MPRRLPILRRALIATALLLFALPALAVLELPFRTQSAFSDILATVALVENPTARQRIAQKRVEKGSAKAFRQGRTLRQCLKDIEKTLRKMGTEFEDEPVEGDSVAGLRARLLGFVVDDVFAAASFLELQIETASSDTEDKRTQKALKPIAKAKAKIIEVSESLLDVDEVDPKRFRQGMRDLGQAVELLDRAARRAKKGKLGDFVPQVPIGL